MNKFLLISGPSGVGKSSIINELLLLDDRFVYISPFTTRVLRKGEKDKISISDQKMDEMWKKGELLTINELYNIRYATPIIPITQALAADKFPVLDWPINKMEIMAKTFPDQLYVVYVLPPSIEVLKRRLSKDGRDLDGLRFRSACRELEAYKLSQYSGICNFEIIGKENQKKKITQTIYYNYINNFCQ